MITQLDTENADRNLTSQVTVLTDTPDAGNPILCQGLILFGDGVKNLDGSGGNFELTVTVNGQTIEPDPQVITFSTSTRTAVWTSVFPVPANAEVILRVKSPNVADTDVDVIAYLYDVGVSAASVNAEVDTALSDYGANTTVPDAAGVAPTAIEIRQEIDSNSTRLDVNVGSRAAPGDSMDMSSISGDSGAADNLESQYDGTGLIGDTYPFTQSGGAALGGGISIKTTMTSVDAILGSEQNLSNANTSDDSRWTGDDDASGAEFIFRCTPVSTSSIPVELSFEGYYDEPTGANNGATIQVYNFNTAGWDTIITLSNSNKDEKHQVPLSHAHKAPGSGTLETVAYTIGDVLIKFKQDTTEAGNAVLLIDYMVVGFVNGLVTAADIQAELEEDSASLLDIIRDELANATDGLSALKSLIDASKTILDTLNGLVEDSAGDRFTEKALETAPTAEMDAAEFQTALLAIVGVTEGGTMTLQKLLKIQAAWIAGKWQDKSGSSTVKELLDADDGATVILEMTLSTSTPQRVITIKI